MLEPISIDKQLVDILKADETEPVSENFDMLGYSSLSPTRNMGFNCIWFIVFPSCLFSNWVLIKLM